jgi:hypothetical protein
MLEQHPIKHHPVWLLFKIDTRSNSTISNGFDRKFQIEQLLGGESKRVKGYEFLGISHTTRKPIRLTR